MNISIDGNTTATEKFSINKSDSNRGSDIPSLKEYVPSKNKVVDINGNTSTTLSYNHGNDDSYTAYRFPNNYTNFLSLRLKPEVTKER